MFHWLNSLSSIIFIAIHRTLSPFSDNFKAFSLTFNKNGCGNLVDKRAFIFLSPPFEYKNSLLWCRTIVDIIPLVEENSRIFKISIWMFSPKFVPFSPLIIFKLATVSSPPKYTNPKCLAVSTKIISSGFSPLYWIDVISNILLIFSETFSGFSATSLRGIIVSTLSLFIILFKSFFRLLCLFVTFCLGFLISTKHVWFTERLYK